MDIQMILELFEKGGMPVLFAVFWYLDTKRFERLFSEFQKEFVINRKMYEITQQNSHDMKDLIMLATREFTKMSQNIRTGQFCPVRRGDGNCHAAPAVGLHHLIGGDA